MKVSVIVPVYNAKKELRRCLDSVLGQTHKELQVLLVNDGSTDGSGEICGQYAQADARVTVCNKANGGVSAARNAGLQTAAGEYICCVDADDAIPPKYVEDLLGAMVRQDAQLAVCSVSEQDKSTQQRHTVPSQNMSAQQTVCGIVNYELDFLPVLGAAAKMYRADVIRENNLRYDTALRRGEDVDFNLRYLQKIQCIAFAPQTEYFYYQKKTSLTKVYDSSIIQAQAVQLERFKQLMAAYGQKNWTPWRRFAYNTFFWTVNEILQARQTEPQRNEELRRWLTMQPLVAGTLFFAQKKNMSGVWLELAVQLKSVPMLLRWIARQG